MEILAGNQTDIRRAKQKLYEDAKSNGSSSKVVAILKSDYEAALAVEQKATGQNGQARNFLDK